MSDYWISATIVTGFGLIIVGLVTQSPIAILGLFVALAGILQT